MFQLWELIGKHLPNHPPDNNNIVEYIREMLANMEASNQEKNFIDAIMLMSGKSLKEIEKLDTIKLLQLFVDGFITNRILDFKAFAENLGITDG